MPRFVILEHDHPQTHWDFMLESGPVLKTWRLDAPPEPGRAVRAEAAFDHRPLYLDYEGPVSGGRGSVRRWDGGSFAWELEGENRVRVRLEGGRCRGVVVLQRGETGEWVCTFEAAGA
jgi:hypothetical protein